MSYDPSYDLANEKRVNTLTERQRENLTVEEIAAKALAMTKVLTPAERNAKAAAEIARNEWISTNLGHDRAQFSEGETMSLLIANCQRAVSIQINELRAALNDAFIRGFRAGFKSGESFTQRPQ